MDGNGMSGIECEQQYTAQQQQQMRRRRKKKKQKEGEFTLEGAPSKSIRFLFEPSIVISLSWRTDGDGGNYMKR